MNKDVDRYFKEIELLLPIFQKEEKEFLKRFFKDFKNDDNLTYSECVERYGEPKEIVYAYFSEMDQDDLLKRVASNNVLKKFLLAILVIDLFAVILYFINAF